MPKNRAAIDVSAVPTGGVAGGVATRDRSTDGRFVSRRYPRVPSEAGATVTNLHLPVGIEAWPDLQERRRQIIEDLGGEDHVSAAKLAILDIGLTLESVGRALALEVADKAHASRKHYRVPHVSRYKATQLLRVFFDSASAKYREIGLNRVARHVKIEDFVTGEPEVEPAPDRSEAGS